MYADQIAEARGLATPIPQNIAADDTCPAIVIQYVPNLGTGGASASFTLARLEMPAGPISMIWVACNWRKKPV